MYPKSGNLWHSTVLHRVAAKGKPSHAQLQLDLHGSHVSRHKRGLEHFWTWCLCSCACFNTQAGLPMGAPEGRLACHLPVPTKHSHSTVTQIHKRQQALWREWGSSMTATNVVQSTRQVRPGLKNASVSLTLLVCLQVWASKWNDRAWLSRKARGVADADLFMACLLQQVHQDFLLCPAAAAAAVAPSTGLCCRCCCHCCSCWHAKTLGWLNILKSLSSLVA